MKSCIVALAASAALTVTPALADIVTSLAPTPSAGVWGQSLLVGASSVSLEDLSGLGGNLENNQIGVNGAVMLTTGFDNTHRAEAAIGTSYSAADVLTTGTLGYSYFKQAVAGGNVFAAPTLKLAILAPGGSTGDNYGQLIYEPSWNQPGGGSQAPTTGDWVTETITSATGAGSTASGGWWWTGGLGEPSGAGGPPIKSLAEWAADFVANDAAGFATAVVTEVSVGVGSYNQGQIGYFDNVSIASTGSGSVTYDFAAIPEPTAALFGMVVAGGFGLIAGRRPADRD